MQQRTTDDTPAWVGRAFALLTAVRQFGFLPAMAQTVPTLVFWNGSTAVQICFNVRTHAHTEPPCAACLRPRFRCCFCATPCDATKKCRVPGVRRPSQFYSFWTWITCGTTPLDLPRVTLSFDRK